MVEKEMLYDAEDEVKLEMLYDYLIPYFINPLKELGFDLDSLAFSYTSPDSYNDVTITTLVFQANESHLPEDFNKVVEIATQETDDNSPCASYRYHMGTLFVFIMSLA